MKIIEHQNSLAEQIPELKGNPAAVEQFRREIFSLFYKSIVAEQRVKATGLLEQEAHRRETKQNRTEQKKKFSNSASRIFSLFKSKK